LSVRPSVHLSVCLSVCLSMLLCWITFEPNELFDEISGVFLTHCK
jgi:hypothetical protein